MAILTYSLEEACIQTAKEFPGLYIQSFIEEVRHIGLIHYSECQDNWIRDTIMLALSHKKIKMSSERKIYLYYEEE